MQRAVHETFRQGIHGWEVTDCRVTMTDCDYQAPPRKWPGTTLWDYRVLTPLVLMTALQQGGTTVHEPVLEFHLEFTAGDLGPIMSALNEFGARPCGPTTHGQSTALDGVIRVARLHHLHSRLPELTHGEGVLETTFGGYHPVQGPPPSRPRTGRDPRDRATYLRQITRAGWAVVRSATPRA